MITFRSNTGQERILNLDDVFDSSLEQLKDKLRTEFGLTGDVKIISNGFIVKDENFEEEKKDWPNLHHVDVRFIPSVPAIKGGAKKRRSKKVKKTSKKTSKKSSKKGSKMMLGGAKRRGAKKSSKKSSKKASRK